MFSLNKDFTAIFSRKYGGIFLAHLGAALVSATVSFQGIVGVCIHIVAQSSCDIAIQSNCDK